MSFTFFALLFFIILLLAVFNSYRVKPRVDFRSPIRSSKKFSKVMDQDIEDLSFSPTEAKNAGKDLDSQGKLASEFRLRFTSSIHDWYGKTRRMMPWRGDPPENKPISAYGVWVSEIMLQQTRVETVISYWNRWMERFPDVSSLAAASPDEVNQMWAGLGYYRRAQNLLLGARYILENFTGDLPQAREDLLRIPGVGPYTAGAIASIAYQKREAAVDGNVYRVMSRIFAIEDELGSRELDKKCWKYSRELMEVAPEPRHYNQAVMELGATVCKPTNPKCSECPVQSLCKAHSMTDGVNTFPVKSSKKSKVKEVEVHVHVLCTRSSKMQSTEESGTLQYLLMRRPAKGLLANQWEFPCLSKYVDTAEEPEAAQEKGKRKKSVSDSKLSSLNTTSIDDLRSFIASRTDLCWSVLETVKIERVPEPVVHIFSHEKHTMHIHIEEVTSTINLDCDRKEDVSWLTAEEMKNVGISTQCKKVLERVESVLRTTVGAPNSAKKKRSTSKEEQGDIKEEVENAFDLMKKASSIDRSSNSKRIKSK